jgi:hypothetical protein
VTSIAVCPYNPDLVAVGGYGGALAVWCISQVNGGHCHSSDLCRPLLKRHTIMSCAILDLQWDPYGFGLYYSTADSAAVRQVLSRMLSLPAWSL